MTPAIFSYANLNINSGFLDAQKKCFAHFALPLVQIQDLLPHGEGLDRWVNYFAKEHDVIAIFDVDAVCTDPEWLKSTMLRCVQEPLVVGGLHNANHTKFRGEFTEDYASPACMVFSRSTWEAAKRWKKEGDLFRCRWHSASQTVWDCAQTFSAAVQEMGGTVECLLPVSIREPKWHSKTGPMTGYGTDYGPCYHEWGSSGNVPERLDAFVQHITSKMGHF